MWPPFRNGPSWRCAISTERGGRSRVRSPDSPPRANCGASARASTGRELQHRWACQGPLVRKWRSVWGGQALGRRVVAAALWLGVTSQVPATFVTAVPTRVPKPWRHVRFTQRSVERLLRGLTPSEVAVLEVLRAGPAVVEDTWGRFGEVVAQLAEDGGIRPAVLSDQVADEHHRGVRSRWSRLCDEHPTLLATA